MGEVSKRRGGARLAPETADKAQDKPDKPTAPEQKADAKRKLLRGFLRQTGTLEVTFGDERPQNPVRRDLEPLSHLPAAEQEILRAF